MNPKLIEGMSTVLSNLGTLGGDSVKEDVVRCFCFTHRTLQQGFVKQVIIPILKHLAEQEREGNYDLRNEASVKLASKMLAQLSEDDLYLPFI